MTEETSNLVLHARREFAALGWPGECEMQAMICKAIEELLKAFSKQGHSGSSAPYALNLFDKLARFQPISPLTGGDDEWMEVSDGLFQNRRCSEVFRQDGEAYWVNGRVFRRPDGVCFTNRDSRVPITFPWTQPEREYVDVPFDEGEEPVTP